MLELPDDLEQIKTINLYEIMKNVGDEMLRTGGPDGNLLIKGAVPMLYINRYKTNNQRLRSLSQRVWRYLKDALAEAIDEDGANQRTEAPGLNIEL